MQSLESIFLLGYVSLLEPKAGVLVLPNPKPVGLGWPKADVVAPKPTFSCK